MKGFDGFKTFVTTKRNVGWFFAALGAILFVTSVISVIATGKLVGDALDVMNESGLPASEQSANWLDTFCNNRPNKDDCDFRKVLGSDESLSTACFGEDASDVPTTARLAVCRDIWKKAIEETDQTLFMSNVLYSLAPGKMIGKNASLSIVPMFFSALIGLALLFVGLGCGTLGRWSGVVINEQNRMSLSQIQVTAWTIVLVSAYAVFVGFNVGLIGETLGRVDSDNVSSFPEIPEAIWWLLGISVSSTIGSSVLNGLKPTEVPSSKSNAGPLNSAGFQLKSLKKNDSPGDAALSDLFLGQDVGHCERVDITRAQNVLFTLVLLITYSASLVRMISDISPAMMIGAVSGPTALIYSLPDPGGSFVGLILLSHAAYIVGKAQPIGDDPALPGTVQGGSENGTDKSQSLDGDAKITGG